MKKAYVIFFAMCLGLNPLSGLASSYKVNNQDVPKVVVLEETGDVVKLQGIAKHKKFFKDFYLGAFYARDYLEGPKGALADPGSKRMVFYYLYTSDSPKPDWQQAILDNNPPEILQREQISISQFLRMIDTPLKEGDVIMLDYIPNSGTKVTVKGSVKGIIKGNEFYTLLLKIWMGRQPPSEKFRKDLFNLSKGIHM